MPFVVTPKTILVEMIYMWRTEVCTNTLWFEKATVWSLADLEDWADAMFTWYQVGLAPQLSADAVLTTIRCTSQESEDAPMFERAITADGEGGSASASVYNNVTWVVQFATALRGRSYRGRNYIVGVPMDVVVNDFVTLTYANAVAAAYATLPNAIDLETVTHVVRSLTVDGVGQDPAVTTPVVSYRYSDLAIDSQRRRLHGRGT